MDKTVYVLIGLPASGKTTWRECFFESLWHTPEIFKVHVVSSDDIIDRLATEAGSTYDGVFQDAYAAANNICRAGFEAALQVGVPRIIVDRTNLDPRSRKYWIRKAKAAGYKVEAIVCMTPDQKEHNYRLNNRDGKTIPQEALKRMRKKFTKPQDHEGFDSVTFYG